MADLIAIVVADVIATMMYWIFLPLSILCNVSITLADVIANLYCGRSYGIEVHLKGGPTIKNLLMTPKDKDPILKRSGVIYRFKCNRVECDGEYIGESTRNFGERFNEHLKAPSPIHDHNNISSHTVSIEDFSILAREDQTSSEPSKKLFT